MQRSHKRTLCKIGTYEQAFIPAELGLPPPEAGCPYKFPVPLRPKPAPHVALLL